MGRRIELPQLPKGQTQEQLQALYSYLYQMAEALNNNLAEIGGAELTDSERQVMNEITGDAQRGPQMDEAETLKSLIIKTANFVRNELNQYRMNLLGEYVAEGKFGKYVRRTGLNVDVTPTGIQQNYTFEEIIQGLKTYEVNAKNYIKTGLLRTVNNVPVYGVAIGKDVVTFSEDGTETYNDGNKVAELTADELSFWQNSTKVAGYTGSRISFYYGGTEAFYILNGKLYAVGDMEITNGKKMIIASGADLEVKSGGDINVKSGGTFNVDATNFKINSSDKYVKTENFTFDNKGISYINNSGKKIAIGEYNSFSSDTDIFSGVYGELNATSQTGKTILAANNFNKNSSSKLIVEAIKRTNSSSYFSAVYPLSEVSTTILGKRSDNPNFDSLTRFTDAYINHIIAQPTTMTIAGDSTIYNGGSFGIVLSSTYDSADTSTWSSAAKLSFSSYENDPSGDFIYVSTGTKYLSFYPTWVYMRSINVDTTGNIHNLRYDTITQNSSRDIKHNIQDMPNMGNVLDKLNPVTFVYDNDENERKRMGLIYEDTIEIMPEICTGDESDKAISYVELIPALLKEIQGLRARVKALEEREGGQ